MITMKKLVAGVGLSAFMLASATAVYAQETTGAIRGQVTNEAGQPVPNATVVILHQPTGTRSTAVTGADGFYTARGLRVGGPYTVTVTGGDSDPETATVERIGVGDPVDVDVTLYAAATVDAVTVTGVRAAAVSSGPSSRYGEDDIENMPSIGRDLRDTFRSDPFVTIDTAQAGAVTVAGTNYRFNSFVVDGVKQNDDFGLNVAFPTQRSPINIDAVEAVSVAVAPYGVLNNDFQGAQINIVTKGGTNRFEGSLYGQYTDDTLIGDSIRGQPFEVEFKEQTWGATFGGPILRDRAFFFVSYEDFEGVRPLSIGTQGSGASLSVNGVTDAEVQAIETALAGTYNFNFDQANSLVGSSSSSIEELDVKEQARVDVNITDNHRLRATYQHTDGTRISEGLTSNSNRLSLRSNQYLVGDELTTWGLNLNSQWSDRLSTEIFYNDKEVIRGQTPVAGCPQGPTGTGDEVCEFAQFVIDAGGPDVVAGPDISRHANELENATRTYGARAYFDLDGVMGSHEFLFGAEREDLDVYNLFAQRTEGEYTFTSIANLQSRNAQRLQYQNAVIDVNGDGERNELDLAANFSIGNTAFYVEDNWQISEDLSLTPGLRYETFDNSERPAESQFFVQRYGFTNSATLDGKDVFLPRLAFEWQPRWIDATLQGGIGLFSGGTPTVYLSNSYSNTGVAGVTVDCQRNAAGTGFINTSTCTAAVAATALTNVNGFDIPTTVEALLNPALGGVATLQRAAAVNALDPDFEIPQTWKASLTFIKFLDLTGFRLGPDWRFTADLLHTRVRYAPFVVDIRGGFTPRGFAPDGRPIYNNATQRGALIGSTGQDFGRDILLTNAEEGYSTTVAFALQKRWDWGLDLTLSQTFNDAQDTQAFTSSTASSNLTLTATSDPQNPQLGTSNYEIAYSTKATASWARKFFGDYETRLSMYAEYRAGRPFSLTFNPIRLTGTGRSGDSVNVFGTTGNNNLFYVPENADATDSIIRYEDTVIGGNVVQTAEQTRQLVAALYGSLGLSEYAGSIVPRNAFRSNDVTRIDLRLQQELPAFFPGGARLKAFVDIQNLGNMLNDEWGVLEEVDFPYMPTVVDVRIDPVTNQYVYSNYRGINTVTSSSFSPTRSVWQVAFGLRYEF